MHYVHLKLGELSVNPANYRGDYEGIDDLAESIAQHGLLQNLCVTEHPEGYYVVKAGNRRLLAIHQLVKAERWPADEPLLCLVRDDDPWTELVENTNRSDVSPWNIGYRYLELLDAGFTMEEVAARLSISIGTVSNYARIARGMHPKIQERIGRLGHKSLSKAQHLSIARQLDEWGEPSFAAQEKLLQRFLDSRLPRLYKKRHKPRVMDHKENVYVRFNRLLNGQVPLPAHATAFVIPVLEYLNGDRKSLRLPPAPKE
jgi:ParB family chromosome partitioning protein